MFMSKSIDLSVGAWVPVGDMSDGRMDTVYVSMPEDQRVLLRKGIQSVLDNDEDADPENTEFYMSQCLATHWLVSVMVPEECVDNPDVDVTWWDFTIVVGIEVDGEWYAWCEDPSDTSAVWFQTPYTRELAYKVRNAAVEYANLNGVYNELADEDDYCTSNISDYLCSIIDNCK